MDDNDRKIHVSTKRFKRTCTEHDSKRVSQTNEKWHQKLLAKIFKKSESIEQARKLLMRVIEKKSVLERELRGKNEEIGKLNDKICTLAAELASTKNDLEKALVEIKLLKDAVRDSASENETIEQKKILHSRKQLELVKTDKLLLNQKGQKIQVLEVNQQDWRSMKYADPHYCDILQKKNHLQRELQEKLERLQSEDDKFQLTGWTKMKSLLERKPANSTDDPDRHIIDYYRTIQHQHQREKIKRISARLKKQRSLKRTIN